MIKYNHNLKNCVFSIKTKKSHHKENDYRITRRCEDIFTFDIETTSAWLNKKGRVIGYKKGKSTDYWNELQPIALCYLWQFSFNDTVYYGRELTDFLQVLEELPKRTDIIIWVHNLAFEYVFLSNILKWSIVFAKNTHKPIKARCEEYPHIEFRCSYMLTRLSLESWGKQLGVQKLVGNLNYYTVRTPLTPLKQKELDYGERDCIVVYEGIKKYKEQYGSIFNIPLTQTGTVRRVVKEKLMSDRKYNYAIKKLVPKTVSEYEILQTVFAGGYTHANRLHSGKVIDKKYINSDDIYIEHMDFASSYPAVMCCKKYPMSPWSVDIKKINEKMFSKKAYIFKLRFKNIKSTNFNTYIQASKCSCTKPLYDNGRIIQAEELELYVTDVDYNIIKNNYEWEGEPEVLECYSSVKGYLPKDLIEYILTLYSNKTQYKDVVGMEDIYMQSKQYVNSCFGMMVTAILQADIIYNDDGTWSINKLTNDQVEERFAKLRRETVTEKRYFLSYSWGIYVTAYARENLWKCMDRCGVSGYDVLYVDTDSIFALGKHDWSWYNEEVTKELYDACEYLNIDFDLTRPKTPKGEEKPLGIFEEEKPCVEFITLGAKRYCERRKGENFLRMTVSGINKDAVKVLKNDIHNFKDGVDFDKDAKGVNKKLCSYVLDMPEVTFYDGYISKYKKGINLRNNGYRLTMTNDYKSLINYLEDEDLSLELIEQRMRATVFR